MKQNIEIKARARDFPRQQQLAAPIATEPARLLIQHDTFYNVPTGRLKLRRFADGSAELIQYDRANETGAKTSNYVVAPVPNHELMHECLTRALGIKVDVRKRRTLIMAGRTRIHFDEVENLGNFIELEVVLAEGDDPAAGRAEAQQIMQQLEIREGDLLDCAYADLLLCS
jgi:predicted adenylyl cyclase CyaB